MKILIIFLLFAIFAFAQADAPVVTTGFGDTAEEAKYSALTAAVEQVLGVMISAETQIVNGELIREKLRANTEGCVESYTVLSNVKDGDSYIATIKAMVSRKCVMDQIEEATHLNDETLSYDETTCKYVLYGAVMCNGGDISLFDMNHGIYADSVALLRYYTGEKAVESQLYFRMTLRNKSGFSTATDQDGGEHQLKYVYMDGIDRNPDKTVSQDYIIVLDSRKGFAYLNKYAQSGLEITIGGDHTTKLAGSAKLKIPAAYIRGFIKKVTEDLVDTEHAIEIGG